MAKQDLYNEALVTANKILELTKGVNLTGDAEDVEQEVKRFTDMVAKRTPLVQKMTELKKQADALPDGSDKAQCDKTWQEVKNIIAAISAENEKQNAVAQKIKASVMATVKGARETAKLNSIYTIPMADMTSGRLDIKN